LRRIAWLSVLSVGAEEGKVWVVGDVEHGWNAGKTAREREKCVRDGAGRAMRLRKESMMVSKSTGM